MRTSSRPSVVEGLALNEAQADEIQIVAHAAGVPTEIEERLRRMEEVLAALGPG